MPKVEPANLWTQEQADEYDNKIACPQCRSTDYEVGEPEFFGCRNVVSVNECNACGAEWHDAFVLYGIGVADPEGDGGNGVAVRTFSSCPEPEGEL